jgi:hypothetical protein
MLLEAAEMRFLRQVAGSTLWDKKRVDEIRPQLGMRKLDKQIQGSMTNWLIHLQKMPSGSALKQFSYY